jgi:Flp pilus assembly protein CpaB
MLVESNNWIFLPPSVVHAPGAGFAIANDVVDKIHVIVPVDLALGGAVPSFVTGQRFVLHDFRVLASDHQISRFQHRPEPEREKPGEVNTA